MRGRMTSRLVPALLSLLLVGLMAGCGAGQPSQPVSGGEQTKEYQEADQAVAEIEASLKLLSDAPTIDEADSDSF